MKARSQRTTKVKRRKEATATRRRPPNDNTLADCRRELREALERHAATNEVLRVIARSPSDTQPVFDTIVTSAARLCKSGTPSPSRRQPISSHPPISSKPPA